MSSKLSVVALLATLMGCQGYKPKVFDHEMKLGGKMVSADVLTQGQIKYMQYCRACHGEDGDGRGPAAKGLRPPPRNFTKAIFKFGGVVPHDPPSLPTDDDFRRIVKSGLHGTAMLPWDVPDADLDNIIQYIKTFSPRWQQEAPGEQLKVSVESDPWRGKEKEGILLGMKLYHGLAQCSSCHPAYASKQAIYEGSNEVNPDSPITDFRDDMYTASPTDSQEYSLDGKHPLRIMPPDFTHRQLRSIRDGHEVEDLFRVVSLGITGAAMPAWKDTLKDEQIWAIAHYVKSLQDLRDTPQADELMKNAVAANTHWQPPADAAPSTDGGAPSATP
jgi:mono/diheme cytochrome c family protein